MSRFNTPPPQQDDREKSLGWATDLMVLALFAVAVAVLATVP